MILTEPPNCFEEKIKSTDWHIRISERMELPAIDSDQETVKTVISKTRQQMSFK